MIHEYGIMGVTSNPTIFEKAIAETSEYDDDIAKFTSEGLSVSEIILKLITKDIKLAADIFHPVFEEAGKKDGFVSVEVRPELARDAEGSIKEARKLVSLIKKSNVMVKIPATVEGLAAIERLTYEGYNINITLLFSVNRYEEVAWAYIKGLEKRAFEGKPVDNISSVASFFVSRVDTLADKLIEELSEAASSRDQKARLKGIIGKVAIANAKCAFIKYNEIFRSERFLKLEEMGASAQRLLWASTGTKDPRYPDTKYVDGLIGRNTVNTMPLQTLLAYYDHGKPALTLQEDLDGARKIISELPSLGVDYDHLTRKLEEDGIKSFSDSYAQLEKCVAVKSESARQEKKRPVEFVLNGYAAPVSEALEEMDDEKFLARLWSKDPTIWKKAPAAKKLIKDALGWLTLPDIMEEHSDSIALFAEEVKEAGFTHVVLLGMGGSSLAPIVLKDTFGPQKGYPGLIVLDSTDPEAIRGVEDSIDASKTLFIVSSKSGSTIELLSLFEYFFKKLTDIKGEAAGENFAAITDPGTPLEGFARKYGFRRVFLNPHDIGGRFSALSYFGLVPAALMGIDISKLLYYAERLSVATHPCVNTVENPGVMLGAALGTIGKSGRDKITFFFSEEIKSLGLWIEQLLAESTGKEGRGLVPVTGEPVGRPEDYGDDRTFVYITLGQEDKKITGLLGELTKAGHPVISFHLKDPYEIGGEFFRWEVATAAAGGVMGINPFDQPDVELSKRLTIARLNGKKAAATPPGVELNGQNFKISFGESVFGEIKKTYGLEGEDSKEAMKRFIGLLKKGDYFGVLAYFNPNDTGLEKELLHLRKVLRDSTKAATQFGFGPRYLHSTGQLHKGGAHNGLFIILSHETGEDLPIPGSSFSFSELELSQAFGDMEALDSKGCRVALFKLKDSSKESLKEVESFIESALK